MFAKSELAFCFFELHSQIPIITTETLCELDLRRLNFHVKLTASHTMQSSRLFLIWILASFKILQKPR
jgi:hypothetical protein